MYPAYDDNKERTNKRNKWMDTKTNGTTNNICIGHVFNGKRFSLRWKNEKQANLSMMFVSCNACHTKNIFWIIFRKSYFKNSLWLRLFSKLLATINRNWLNFQSPSGAQSFVTFQALDKPLKFLKLFCVFMLRVARKVLHVTNRSNLLSNANCKFEYEQVYYNFTAGFVAYRGKTNLNFQEIWLKALFHSVLSTLFAQI